MNPEEMAKLNQGGDMQDDAYALAGGVDGDETHDTSVDFRNIERDLGEVETEREEVSKGEDNAPHAKETAKLDLSNLTAEQIDNLRNLLESTPRKKRKEGVEFNTITLREIGGRFVVETKTAQERLILNEEKGVKELRNMIMVRFHGSPEWHEVVYKDLIVHAPRVECKVLGKTSKEVDIPTGRTTFKRDKDGFTGVQEVEMYITYKRTTYKVQLPDGTDAVIDEQFINI